VSCVSGAAYLDETLCETTPDGAAAEDVQLCAGVCSKLRDLCAPAALLSSGVPSVGMVVTWIDNPIVHVPDGDPNNPVVDFATTAKVLRNPVKQVSAVVLSDGPNFINVLMQPHASGTSEIVEWISRKTVTSGTSNCAMTPSRR